MSLRHKTLLIIGAVILVLFAGQHLLTHFILVKSYVKLEEKSVARDLARAQDAFDNELVALDRICADYAAWDETCQFMSDSNSAYIATNLTEQTFVNLKVNLMLYLGTTGKIQYAQAFDESSRTFQPLPASLLQAAEELFTANIFGQTGHKDGLLALSSGPLLISANPILTSKGEGPSRGTLIMARHLDDDNIKRLSAVTHLSLDFFPINDPKATANVRHASESLNRGSLQFVVPVNRDTVAGYAYVRDVYGKPQLIMGINVPREVYAKGIASERYIIISILVVSLVLGAAILVLMERLVLSRVARLSKEVNEIGGLSDFSARLPVSGEDELASLASNLNNMLAALEQSDNQLQLYTQNLEALVEERTWELKISENKLRSIFVSSPDAISVTDLQSRIIDCNQAALAMYGCQAREEAVGHLLYEFLPPEEHDRFSADMERTRREKVLRNAEYLLIKKDGAKFPAELSASLIQDEEGDFICFAIMSRDITERKHAQDELRWNEALLRAMADSSPLAFYVVDTRTDDVLFFNRHFCEIWGIPELEERMRRKEIKSSEVLSACLAQLSDPEQFLQLCRGQLGDSSLQVVEEGITFRDGRIVRYMSNLIRDDQGGYLGRLCIFEDVTAHQQAEHALALSEHRYRLLFERNLAGVFRITLDGRILDCNDSFARIFGYTSRQEIMSVNAERLYCNSGDREDFLQKLQDRGTIADYEMQLRRQDGAAVWILGNFTIVLGDTCEPLVIQGTVIDVTERRKNQEHEKELQLELMQQSRLAGIGMLAAGIAHNVNVPLQGIITHIELLKLTRGDTPYLDDILEQAMRISAIINNMLHKSRQEQCQQEQEIDLNRLLTEELEFLNADLAFKHEINKNYDFDPGLPPVPGIYSDFSQALLNVVRNSIDAMHSSRKKWLSVRTARCDDGAILIEVKDTGCGINPEIRNRIFEPFFTTKPMAGQQSGDEPVGTGLGLSSTYQLLRKYNARFELQSEVGKGTAFRIFIPHQPVYAPQPVLVEDEPAEKMVMDVL